MTSSEKANQIIDRLRKAGVPVRHIPDKESMLQDEFELSLKYLRLNIPHCPICKGTPIVVGGTTPRSKNIFFKAHCCGYETELSRFEKLLDTWLKIKRK